MLWLVSRTACAIIKKKKKSFFLDIWDGFNLLYTDHIKEFFLKGNK